jgi:hypothetical protein
LRYQKFFRGNWQSAKNVLHKEQWLKLTTYFPKNFERRGGLAKNFICGMSIAA